MIDMKVYFLVLLAAQSVAGFSVRGPKSAVRGSSLFMTTVETATKDIKVGVIGCGRIGLVHLEAITKAPGVTPIIVSNPTVSKAEAGELFWLLLLCSQIILSFSHCLVSISVS